MCETNSNPVEKKYTFDNQCGVIGGPKRITRLQQLKEEREYYIVRLGNIQAQITLIESDPAFEVKFEELTKLGY